jgi:hypothetical protein
MGKDEEIDIFEETEELIKILITRIKTAEKNRNGHSRFDIRYLQINETITRSGATSLFDVRCWTFDVRRSSFKTTLYGKNVTSECLQNNLTLIGRSS